MTHVLAPLPYPIKTLTIETCLHLVVTHLKTVKNPFFIDSFFAGMDVECDSTDARRSVKFITGPFAGTNIVEDKVGSASNGGYTYAFVNDEM